MTNASIPLQVNSLDTATPIQQMGQSQNNNALASEQLLQQHYQSLDAREKSRLSSTISGAVQLNQFLDKNDVEGAHDFLMQRKNMLQGRIGNGENIDTEDTDHAIDLLRQGKVDELKQGIQGLMAAGQVYGILNNKDMPSNVQEWQYYNNLPDDQKSQYLTMKRANQTVNLGGSQDIPNPANPAGKPLASFPVTPKPEDVPSFRKDQKKAEAEGTAAGEANANAQNTVDKSAGLLASLENLKISSAAAPSGGISDVASSLSNKAGVGTKGANAQGDFTVKRAAAENAIRKAFRVAGSGGTSDRDAIPFIQMLPEATDSESVKITKTNAAIQAVKDETRALAKQRGLADPFPDGSTGGKIRVTNGQETYDIDPTDLQDALKDGFKQQ